MPGAIGDRDRSLAGRLVGGPRGLRGRLERLGPTFIKIGQYLALRPDLVPQEYCDELMLLQDRVSPFPWRDARIVIAEDLGADPAELFAHVNPRPVAAGSLAQTHLARLRDGTEVAVKVQRPGIRARVLRDLGRAELLARLLDLAGASLVADPEEVVAELRGWLLEEIDVRRELANLTRLSGLASGSTTERMPRPYPELSGARVLTTEFLRGVPFSELLFALRSGESEQRRRVEGLGIDRDRLAARLITATLRQVFEYQFFHADVHPGNLLALPDDVIGYVDFGLCAELDETVRERQLRYLAASYTGSPEQIFRALLDILVVSDRTDVEAFRLDFLAETRAWQSRFRGPEPDGRRPQLSTNGPVEERRSPIADYLVALMRVARRHGLQVPAGVLAMYRALTTADAVAHQLSSEADLGAIGRRFFERLRTDEVLRSLDRENLRATVLSATELLREAPGQLHEILTELSEGDLTLNMSVLEAPIVARARNRRVRLVVTAILAVSVALLLTIPEMPSPFGVSLREPLWAALLLLYGWIFWQWRRLR